MSQSGTPAGLSLSDSKMILIGLGIVAVAILGFGLVSPFWSHMVAMLKAIVFLSVQDSLRGNIYTYIEVIFFNNIFKLNFGFI